MVKFIRNTSILTAFLVGSIFALQLSAQEQDANTTSLPASPIPVQSLPVPSNDPGFPIRVVNDDAAIYSDDDSSSAAIQPAEDRRSDDDYTALGHQEDDDEGRRPRGFLAALFGYPDEYEGSDPAASQPRGVAVEAPAMFRGSANARGLGSKRLSSAVKAVSISPPKTSSTFKSAMAKKTTTTEAPSSERDDDTTETSKVTVNDIEDSTSEEVTEAANATSVEDIDESGNSTTNSTKGTSGNKREASPSGGFRGPPRGPIPFNGGPGQPLPAGYILWHPVPAPFFGGPDVPEHSLSTQDSPVVLPPGGGQRGPPHQGGPGPSPFLPHRPLFVEPFPGQFRNPGPFPITQFSSPPVFAISPEEAKGGRGGGKGRGKGNKKGGKGGKSKHRPKGKPADEEPEIEDEGIPPERGLPRPVHVLLPPIPPHGFRGGPNFEFGNPNQQQFNNDGGHPNQFNNNGGPPPNSFGNQQNPEQNIRQQQQQPSFDQQRAPQNINNDFRRPPNRNFNNNNFNGNFNNGFRGPPPNGNFQGPNGNNFGGLNGNFQGPNGNNFPGPNSNSFQGPNGNNFQGPNGNNFPGPNGNNFPGPNGNNFPGPNGNNFQGPNGNFGGPNGNNFDGPNGNNFGGPNGNDFDGSQKSRRPSPSPSAHPAKFEIDHQKKMQEEFEEAQEAKQRPLDVPPPPFIQPIVPPPIPPPAIADFPRDQFRFASTFAPFSFSSPPPQFLEAGPGEGPAFNGGPNFPPRPLPSPPPHSSHSGSFTTPSPAPRPSFSSPAHGVPALSLPPPLPSPFPGRFQNGNLGFPSSTPQSLTDDDVTSDEDGLIYTRDFKKQVGDDKPTSESPFPVFSSASRQPSAPTGQTQHFGSQTQRVQRFPAIPQQGQSPFPRLPPSSPFSEDSGSSSQGFRNDFRANPNNNFRGNSNNDFQGSSNNNFRDSSRGNNQGRRKNTGRNRSNRPNRLPNTHPNLPDFKSELNPTERQPESSTLRPEVQPIHESSTQSSFTVARDNYASPGFHTGHKGFPSSVTVPSFEREGSSLSTTLSPRSRPTSKSQDRPQQSSTLKGNNGQGFYGSTFRTSFTSSPAAGSKSGEGTVDYHYEIQYQSPVPAVATYTTAKPPLPQSRGGSSTSSGQKKSAVESSPEYASSVYQPAVSQGGGSYKPGTSRILLEMGKWNNGQDDSLAAQESHPYLQTPQ